jgi:hypothetical protein
MDGVRQFFDAVVASTAGPPRFGRAKRLVALPLVGTGLGGAADKAGEMVQALLPELEDQAQRLDLDVALVLWTAPSYAAAQAERARRNHWPSELTQPLRDKAEKLANLAAQGRLALFLGAGVSIAAGLPGWADMIKALARHASFSDEELKALSGVHSALDQATIVERRLERRGVRLGDVVKEVFRSCRNYALTHALLAALPVREVITTNYDQLFEQAWILNAPQGISILPARMKAGAQHWLLKMHGCLSAPRRVVLTRDSYTRYDEYLPALAGIVQGFLVTRHMLFVGFSLTDDNFHRIIDAVRRMRKKVRGTGKLGTALSLFSGGLVESLWEQDLDRVRMDDRTETLGAAKSVAARRLEIFLDYLAMKTRNTAHLLVGKRFDDVLTEGELILRDALHQFVDYISERQTLSTVRQTVAWPQVERLLADLGYDVSNHFRKR